MKSLEPILKEMQAHQMAYLKEMWEGPFYPSPPKKEPETTLTKRRMPPGIINTSPRAVRAAFLKNKTAAPVLPVSGYRVGELVRLYGSNIDEYIVLDETPVEQDNGPTQAAIGLFGGRDNNTQFRVVFRNRIKGRVTKPKTRHGRAASE